MEIIKKDTIIKINRDNVLLFDMDGTLVDTDFANFLSYQEAIQSVIQSAIEIQYIPDERFNRTTLNKVIPNLTEENLEKIIQQKEKNYKNNLTQTKLNKSVYDILIKHSKTNKTVLVTNCRKERAILTLEYHKLTDKFSHLFFKKFTDNGKRVNKYKDAITSLSLSGPNVIVFENERTEIDDALLAGIPIDNIISL